jgi:hypothetical protein
MDKYRHHVSGFFTQRKEAEKAFSKLVERGLPREHLQIFGTEPVPTTSASQQARSEGVLKDVLVDGAIGTAVGAGLGALVEVALVATSVSLFVASPLIAPLMLLGWGASVGGLIGVSEGAVTHGAKKKGWLSDLVRDAISSGQFVLVAETRTEQETVTAREVIKASVGDCTDVRMA